MKSLIVEEMKILNEKVETLKGDIKIQKKEAS
jgi:hypothetical protein